MLQDVINSLLEAPHGRLVKDTETGHTLTDLSKAVAEIQNYSLAPLKEIVLSQGISKQAQDLQLHYQYKLSEIERHRQYELAQARAMDEAFAHYAPGQTREGRAFAPPQEQQNQQDQRDIAIPQLSGDLLTHLSDLIRNRDDRAYRQQLTKRLLAHKQKAEALTLERNETEAALKALTRSDEEPARREAYKARFEKDFPPILTELRHILRAVNHLHTTLGGDNFRPAESLYQVLGRGGAQPSRPRLDVWDLYRYALLLFVSTLGTLLIAMLVRWMKSAQ